MIAGILYADPKRNVIENEISSLFDLITKGEQEVQFVIDGNFAVGLGPSGVNAIDENSEIWLDRKRSAVTLFSGSIFNRNRLFDTEARGISWGEVLYDEYMNKKTSLLSELNGNYVLAFWNGKNQQLSLAQDHLGIEPLYYFHDDDKLVFASSIKAILRHPEIKAAINFGGLHSYLLFNYNPSQETLISGIKKLPQGHSLVFENRKLKTERYWCLSFNGVTTKNEQLISEELLSLLKDSVKVRVRNDATHGAFLSGGMDSSTVVGLMKPLVNGKIHTFSFRCKGKSFDESHYAKIVCDRYETDHHLVEYDAENALLIDDVVALMDEPFSDIGIEVASFILGKYAQGMVDYVLTGDGGDELFAGHPVYQADQVAQKFSRLPSPLQKAITGIFSLFPDTDKKKSFAVKAQRFAYSYQFSEKLFSNRWRIYYQPSELKRLFQNGFTNKLLEADPLLEIEAIYQQADGVDHLSKTLYGDYFTVVSFYLRRMQLLRAFGIEGRFPMLDPRLVEYAAKIPSELKLKGSETKYILHKTMSGVLPDEIVFRKDKLGHSVPFKNWLRDEPRLKGFIQDILSPEKIKKRGFFNPAFVENLLTQHFKKTKNNSHRLWALTVLELWMQKNIDK
ncbi:MAG TPA: asparagine synthase (glutamine-hydrolyzing) [bacterium]|nr:asparagine synthase (glutamine-hydrolyzing) [bacterium]